jgi:hypothetical protein
MPMTTDVAQLCARVGSSQWLQLQPFVREARQTVRTDTRRDPRAATARASTTGVASKERVGHRVH